MTDCIGAIDQNTIITFTGSTPKGITASEVLTWLKIFQAKGAKIVIDSRSVTLAELLDFKPWLIKPNKDEAEAYAKGDICSINDAVEIAQAFSEKGVENVIISLGGDGAVLVDDTDVVIAKAPKIDVRSTIGAGDSMLAGFIDGTVKGFSKTERLKRAIAFGSAACMQEGTLPPQKVDIEKMAETIIVEKG